MAVLKLKDLFDGKPPKFDQKALYRFSKRQVQNINIEVWSSQNPSTLHAIKVTRLSLMSHERWLMESSHEVENIHYKGMELHSNQKEFMNAFLKALAYSGMHLGLGLNEELEVEKEVVE